MWRQAAPARLVHNVEEMVQALRLISFQVEPEDEDPQVWRLLFVLIRLCFQASFHVRKLSIEIAEEDRPQVLISRIRAAEAADGSAMVCVCVQGGREGVSFTIESSEDAEGFDTRF